MKKMAADKAAIHLVFRDGDYVQDLATSFSQTAKRLEAEEALNRSFSACLRVGPNVASHENSLSQGFTRSCMARCWPVDWWLPANPQHEPTENPWGSMRLEVG